MRKGCSDLSSRYICWTNIYDSSVRTRRPRLLKPTHVYPTPPPTIRFRCGLTWDRPAWVNSLVLEKMPIRIFKRFFSSKIFECCQSCQSFLMGSYDKIVFVQVVVWYRTDAKPLPESIRTRYPDAYMPRFVARHKELKRRAVNILVAYWWHQQVTSSSQHFNSTIHMGQVMKVWLCCYLV